MTQPLTLVPAVQGPLIDTIEAAQPSPSTVPAGITAQRIPFRFGGQIGTIPIEEYGQAIQQGGTPVTADEYAAHQAEQAEAQRQSQLQKDYGNLGNQVEAAAVGGLSGLSLGVSDAAFRAIASPQSLDRIRKEREANQITYGLSKGLGMLAPMFLPGGAEVEGAELVGRGAQAAEEGSAAIRGAQAAVDATQAAQAAARAPGLVGQAVGGVARTLAIPQRLVTATGEAVERGIADLLPKEAGTLAARLGAKAAALAGRGVVEGGIYTGADYLGENALSQNPQLDGDKLLAHVGVGMLLGGGLGGVLGLGVQGASELESLISPFLKRQANEAAAGLVNMGRNGATIRKADEIFTERTPTITNAREGQGAYMMERLPPKAGESSVEYAPRATAAREDLGEKLGAFMTDADAAGIEMPTVKSSLEALSPVRRMLEEMPAQNRPAIEALKDLEADIQHAGESNTQAAVDASIAQAQAASAEVRVTRAAEVKATRNAEHAVVQADSAAGKIPTAEANLAQAERNAVAATAAMDAIRAKYADVSPIPRKIDEIRTYFNTPEGLERIGNFMEGPFATKGIKAKLKSFLNNPEGARDYRIPRGMFSANEIKIEKEAQAAIRPAETMEKSALRARRDATEALEAARSEHAARMAEVDVHDTNAITAKAAREAAEAKVAAVTRAKGDAVQDAPLTFKQLSDIRKTNDAKIKNWFSEIGADRNLKGEAMQRAGRALESHVSDVAERGMKKLGHEDWRSDYQATKTDYRKMKNIEEGATKSARSQMKNRRGSLTDYMTGLTLGHLADGPVGLGVGLASAMGHKVLRERGSSTTAVLLDKLSAMTAIQKAVKATDDRLAEAVDALAGDAKPKLTKSPKFDDIQEMVQKARSNPERFAQDVEHAFSPLSQHAPQTVEAAKSAAIRAVAYLASTLPEEKPLHPLQPQLGSLPVPDSVKRDAVATAKAVMDIPGSLQDLAANKLRPAGMTALLATGGPVVAQALLAVGKRAQERGAKPLKSDVSSMLQQFAKSRNVTGPGQALGITGKGDMTVMQSQVASAPPPPSPGVGSAAKTPRGNPESRRAPGTSFGHASFSSSMKLTGSHTGGL